MRSLYCMQYQCISKQCFFITPSLEGLFQPARLEHATFKTKSSDDQTSDKILRIRNLVMYESFLFKVLNSLKTEETEKVIIKARIV